MLAKQYIRHIFMGWVCAWALQNYITCLHLELGHMKAIACIYINRTNFTIRLERFTMIHVQQYERCYLNFRLIFYLC